ncbi:Protein fmp52, mitochondrial [Purpureocillium takamizusanense]|uniref:Protein fmp52, mitochondrial n=1 Tax=Purpureocillium takamizusanense TaxID=2060973 RepID=A0A9Q8VDB8_9HYPO|nr:Protein fmp52, mitochondrial [Purpureocillium takamizusanense]UNI22580.1 Protein fmp52, mitochondrial [Purpureocillium takamizusanense]
MSSAAVIGSTGLVGSNILSTLLSVDTFKTVHTISRRAPKATAANLNAIVEEDNSKWGAALAAIAPLPTAVFSALGTTRAAAGSIENQWKVDHDLNIELATAAKKAGVKTFVFVSSGGTRGFLSSSFPYSKMKNGVEDAIKALDFEQAIILRPGMLLGNRGEGRALEGIFQGAVRGLGSISHGLQDSVGQEADVVARAAIRAVQLANEGKAPGKYWSVEQKDIVRLGRTEWPEKPAAEPTTPAAQ